MFLKNRELHFWSFEFCFEIEPPYVPQIHIKVWSTCLSPSSAGNEDEQEHTQKYCYTLETTSILKNEEQILPSATISY